MSETFGAFVRRKRLETGVSLRAFAQKAGVSSVYQSSFEQGIRTAPNGETLKKIATLLKLNNEEEKKLYDLAVETKSVISTPYDITCYIKSNDIVKDAIRTAKDNNISEDKWREFISSIS